MKIEPSYPGKYYVVTSPNGCTVTAMSGKQLGTVEAGQQGGFAAIDSAIIVSDDEAEITQVFKLAPQQKLALLGVLGGNASGLPAGYKRVEYLESTGTQYILTDYLQKDNDVYDFVFGHNNSNNYLFGARTEWNNKNISFHYDYSLQRFTAGWGNYNSYVAYSPTGLIIQTKIRKGILIANGEEMTFSSTTNEPVYPLSVFATNQKGSPLFSSSLRVCSLKATRDNKEKLNIVPALDPTGAPCMFDIASRTAFYNQGTGDFLYPTASTAYGLRRVLPDWGKLTENGLRRLYHAPADWQGELYDYAIEHGYKPIIEPEKPEDGYWSPRWTETADEIVLEWVETEPPTDEFGLPAEDLT